MVAATQPADARYQFLARFGAVLLSGGIAAIPMALYHYQADLGLSPQEVWFVGYILAHRWTAALPYPSLRRMSRRTGTSTQMLHRYKQSLVDKGYLVTIPRHRPSGGRTSNFYDFSGLFLRLEQYLLRDRRDPSWQPTVDEREADGDDAEESALSAISGAPITPFPIASAAQAGVPESQRSAPSPLSSRLTGVSQRALIGDTRLGGASGEQGSGRGRQVHRAATVNAGEPQRKGPANEISINRSLLAESEDAPEHRATRPASETRERSLQNERTGSDFTERSSPQAVHLNNLEDRWERAKEKLADTMTAAAFQAWIAPLHVLYSAPDAPKAEVELAGAAPRGSIADPQIDDASHSPLLVSCSSSFQRDHVDRRYRRRLEDALGAPIELTVHPRS